MAFDLYVGSLHRYRMGDWLNVGQQIAEEEGFTYVMHGRSARVEGALNRLVAERSYKSWVKRAEAGLKRAGLGPWNDDPSQDYVTDRPGWEGFVGMCLKFAYLLNPSKPEASQVPSFVVAQEDEAFMLAAEHSYPFRCLALCEVWLPGNFEGAFELKMPNGHRAFAASLDRLSDVINQFAFLWNKDRAELNALQTVQPRADDPLEDAALHGLAVFARMTSEAIDRRLPMLIDC